MRSIFSKAVLLFMAAILSACGLGPFGSVPPTAELPTEVPATEIATVEVAATEAPIVHTTIPSEPAKNLGNASDNDEVNSSEDRDVNFGDDFLHNRFERPFTTEMAEYLPEVDIVNFSIGEDDNFFYVTLNLAGVANPGQFPTGHYAIELDSNIDGRGELLIVANPSFGGDWSTDGVQIFADDNGDVGGNDPKRSDSDYIGDGYEKLMFDSGVGANPDLGWSRFVNGDTPAIQIAFNKVIFPATPQFMWSVWASASQFDTTKFNLHDSTTADAAGSPDKQSNQYPIKNIAGIDNSCRVPVGFTATGFEPLGCPVAGVVETETEAEEAPSSPSNPGITITVVNICQQYPALCELNP